MMVTNLMTKQVLVLRLKDVGGNKMALSTVTSTMSCEIQPMSDEKTGGSYGVSGKTFVGYTDGRVSLYPGDKLQDRKGNIFTVKSGGVSVRQFVSIGYTKVIMEITSGSGIL